MNKILLPLLALILVACASPKVTVVSEVTVTSSPPTATPIPTPTLHPQFVALQESIAASGERFTLLPDGTIQDGAITVPGLSVDKTGAITLRGLSSQVTLDAADVSFDDENGVDVAGYTLDEATGKWVTTELTPEEQLTDDMKLLKLSGTPETDVDGNLILKNESGKIIYRNGAWSSEEIVKIIEKAGVCRPTEYQVDPNGKAVNSVLVEQKDVFRDYHWNLFNKIPRGTEFRKTNYLPLISGSGDQRQLNYNFMQIPVENTDQCWTFFVASKHAENPFEFNSIMFETNDGQAIGMTLFQP